MDADPNGSPRYDAVAVLDRPPTKDAAAVTVSHVSSETRFAEPAVRSRDVPVTSVDAQVVVRPAPVTAANVSDADAAARRALLEEAERQPMLVVYEDLHWADPTSLALLERALALTERVPLLLLWAAHRFFKRVSSHFEDFL